MDKISDEIQGFESLTTAWIGSEIWLGSAVEKLHEDYKILRRDIRANSTNWSHAEYCERIAYHYYNLGSFYNDLYNDNKINIRMIKNYLQKCLGILNEIPNGEYSKNTEELKKDAEHYLNKVEINIKTIGRKRNDLIRKKNFSNEQRRDYLKLCVLLDDTDNEKFTECINRCCGEYKKDLGRKIQNIQLLKIISELENAISFYDNENDFQLVHLSDRLSRAYKLTGQDLLSKEYEKASQRLFLKFSTEQTTVVDNKNRIKTTILNEIREHNSSLEQVISYIEEDVHVLNNIDRNYIERKYLKYSSNLWLEETCSFIKKQLELKNRGIIDIIITSLDAVQNLNQIPNPLNQLKYYQLLDKHHNLIDEKYEKDILDGFKEKCLEQLRNCIESLDEEMELLNAFIDFMSTVENIELISTELKLNRFCSNKLTFTELLDNITKLEARDDKLMILKKTINCLERDDTFFIEDKLKEVITSYLKPVEVQERKENNRFVIEARARNVTISKILPSIESKLSKNPSVEEIHIIGIDIIHVDANLKNEIWHGKNIVVYTKKIKVVDKIVWDVSGVNNNHEYADNAGTDEHGHGNNGADGFAGESGGNVLILTESIENERNLTVVSNGGNGATGQDGGNGKNGENGKGITVTDFKKKYPSVIKTFNGNVEKMLVGKLMYDLRNSKFITNWSSCGHVFVETVTEQGNKIIFSYCKEYTFETYSQGFLLYKGSVGQVGGTGGEYGLGGLGGYAGDVVIKNPKNPDQMFNVDKYVKNGENGINGKGGLYGQHGENGWDMAYTDYQFWQKMDLYGDNDNNRYEINYYNDNGSDRIWCPYKDKYARICVNNSNRKIKKYEERKNTRENQDRQHHSQAVRKKTISEKHILHNYSRRFNRTENNLVEKLQSTKQSILKIIRENREQQGNETKKLAVQHSYKISYLNESGHRNFITSGKYIDGKKTRKNPEISINCPNDWFRLKHDQISRSEFDRLYTIFEAQKNNIFVIEKLLFEKYRLIILRDIANDLPLYQNETDEGFTHGDLSKYLIDTGEKNFSDLSHDELGTFDQYFYTENNDARTKISEYFKQLLKTDKSNEKNYRIVTRTLSTFVSEIRKSMEVDEKIKKYYIEHKEFVENQESNLNTSIRPIVNELSRQGRELYESWFKTGTDTILQGSENDSFLKILRSRFRNQLKLEYDWDECRKDQNVLGSFDNHIRRNGPSSESYRQLLSLIYDVNIVVYDKTRDDTFRPRSNHNPSSKRKLYVLSKDDELTKLHFNQNHLKLDKERSAKNDVYGKILSDLQNIEEKSKLDDYFKNKTFLCEDGNFNRYRFIDTDEKRDVENIVKYFPKNERLPLKQQLDKIQYIEYEGIIQMLSKRFNNERAHVDSQILCYLINVIISAANDDRKEQDIFRWIIASYPQENWIDQIIIIEIENHFRNLLTKKSEWLEYLSNVRDKNTLLSFAMKLDRCKLKDSISIECIDTTLYLLSRNLELTVDLDQLELFEWSYALKENYWSHRLNQLAKWNKNDLTKASYYLSSVENIFGTILVEKFINILENKRDVSTNVLNVTLSNFYNETWNLGEDELKILSACDVKPWMRIMDDKFHIYGQERSLDQLIELIRNRDDVSQEIKTELSTIKDSIENMYELPCTRSGKLIKEFTISDVKDWTKKFKENLVGLKDDDERKRFIVAERMEVLAVVDRAIYLTKSFKLRHTQKLSVLTLLAGKRNALAQISTGEGKSLIVVSLAIIKALCFEKIDIVTSSSVLAIRDAENHRDVYGVFDLSVSHNCNEDIEKRKEAYSSNQIVYGELSNFQRDYLLDKFYGKNILGDRHFENVIVDEVDSMLLDKGNNMLYLSHDLVGFDKIESVYIYIWQWINQPANDQNSISHVFDSNAIKESVLNELYGTLNKNDIKMLDSNLSQQQVDVIWYRLIEKGILDHKGKLLRENLYAEEMNEIFSFDLCDYKTRFGYLFRECNGKEMNICVPNYLKPFIELHLEAWIENALNAFFMKPGTSYVVDVDRTGNNQDRNPNIRILDRDTGTDQTNSQWNEALHQFLQLKHGCKISLQSLKAVFISNVSFLKQYECLYGLTGTLGSQIERDLLQQVHQVDFITIPTAKSKQFYEDSPIICSNREEWTNHICDETIKTTEIKRRSVLIICETINEAEVLHKAFMFRGVKNVHKYTRDYEEFDVGRNNEELTQGQIIIATNLAGRGTDIKITEELKEAGGLHVFLTYLPNNIRIEQQAFGRAARCGDKGSGQLIVMDSKTHLSRILELKKERDVEELHRVSNVKIYYETQIVTEEKCFQTFKEQYERLKNILRRRGLSGGLVEILLQSCLDKWAFWLDKYGNYIKNLKNDRVKREFQESLNVFLLSLIKIGSETESERVMLQGVAESQRCDRRGFIQTGGLNKNQSIPGVGLPFGLRIDDPDWSAWVDGHPIHMIKLGVYYDHSKKYDDALALFDKVIKHEPNFCEAAHYYKAFTLSKKIDWENKPLTGRDARFFVEMKNELLKAKKLFNKRNDNRLRAAAVVNNIKENTTENIRNNPFEKQQNNVCDIYDVLSRSIDDITGHQVTPKLFINHNVDEELAEMLYEDLLENGILKKSKIRNVIDDDVIRRICRSYGASSGSLRDFLDEYRGREIDEINFQKSMKRKIDLANRETFWKSLVHERVFIDEIKYVVIDDAKLERIDPSLLDFIRIKINDKLLKREKLKYEIDEIFLYNENIPGKSENIFVKSDFIETIGKNEYALLKKKNVFMFNKKARVDVNKIDGSTLSFYDSIVLDDFKKLNVCENEARLILNELVTQKVIEPRGNIDYRLTIEYDEIDRIRFDSFPIYEHPVKILLSTCFAYRIASQKIKNQINEKDSPLKIKLAIKPHRRFFWELLEERIIEPVRVGSNEGLEDKLNKMYPSNLTENDIKQVLLHNSLVPREYTEELCARLIEKEFVTPVLYSYGNISTNLSYVINDSKKRKPFNFYIDSGGKIINVKKTLETVFDDRLKLNDVKNIAKSLEQASSLLKVLSVPDFNLKPLTDFCHFANMEEVNVVLLNGLSHVIKVEEMRWTLAMIFNAIAVVILGILQIVVGVVISLFSAGAATFVGSSFISEGVGDVMFAVDALISGYFSWKNYAEHKVYSVLFTAVTCFAGGLASKVTKFSYFGSKLAGVNFQYGNRVARMCGTELIKNVGWKTVGKEVVKCVSVKVVEAVATSLVYVGIDTIIENYFQSFCQSVASILLSNIEETVRSHNISSTLREVYDIYGDKESYKIVTDLTNRAFSKNDTVDILMSLTNKIFLSVFQGISEGRQKMGSTSTVLYVLGKILVWGERVKDIAKIIKITDDFLNDLNQEMKHAIKNKTTDGKNASEKGFEDFKTRIVDFWSSQLHDKAGKIIQQNLVGPVIKEGLPFVTKRVVKLLKNNYNSYQAKRFLNRNQNLPDLRQTRINPTNETSPTQNYITDNYHKNLIKLFKKTNNPKLFAEMIRENVPMDLTCVDACVEIISKKYSQPVVCVVEGENDIRYEFTHAKNQKLQNAIILNVKLQNNRFRFYDNDQSTDNNCLFNALQQALPHLSLEPRQFRNDIENMIENNINIKQRIRQYLHKLPKIFGRARNDQVGPDEIPGNIKDGTDHTRTENPNERIHLRTVPISESSTAVKKRNNWIIIDHKRSFEGNKTEMRTNSLPDLKGIDLKSSDVKIRINNRHCQEAEDIQDKFKNMEIIFDTPKRIRRFSL